MTTEERDEAVQVWRHLKSENAPFRVLTKSGLVSAPLDHFDDLLLHCASADWKKQSLIIGSVMVEGWPCLQVGDLMLHARVMALVEAGKLIAEGDPRDITSRVRSPG